MGTSSSTPSSSPPPPDVSDSEVKEQLEKLKQELIPLAPAITEGVISKSCEDQDALVIRYGDLADKTKIAANIKNLFPNHPVKNFIVDIASAMIEAMASTKEMEDLMRWQKKQVIKTVGGKIYGMELQYKVQLLNSTRGMVRTTKETTLLIAYKSIVHIMAGNPQDHPTDDELKQLTF